MLERSALSGGYAAANVGGFDFVIERKLIQGSENLA